MKWTLVVEEKEPIPRQSSVRRVLPGARYKRHLHGRPVFSYLEKAHIVLVGKEDTGEVPPLGLGENPLGRNPVFRPLLANSLQF